MTDDDSGTVGWLVACYDCGVSDASCLVGIGIKGG